MKINGKKRHVSTALKENDDRNKQSGERNGQLQFWLFFCFIELKIENWERATNRGPLNGSIVLTISRDFWSKNTFLTKQIQFQSSSALIWLKWCRHKKKSNEFFQKKKITIIFPVVSKPKKIVPNFFEYFENSFKLKKKSNLQNNKNSKKNIFKLIIISFK